MLQAEKCRGQGMAKAAKGAEDFPVTGNHEERRAWFETRLKGRSREDCILLAGRAALRVVPLLRSFVPASERGASPQSEGARHLLGVLRCNALSLVASLAPTSERERFRAAASFSAAASAYAYAASAASAYAAYASAAYASAASAYAAYASAAASFSAAAFAIDLAALDGKAGPRRARTLSTLWPDGMPSEISAEWSKFAQDLRGMGDDFDIWADWYGGGTWNGKAFPGVLQGTPSRGPSLFGLTRKKALAVWHDIALIPDEFWKDPARVNAEMKRIVAAAREEELGKQKKPPPEDTIIEIPPQKPASLEPIWQDGKLQLPSSLAPADIVETKLSDALEALKQSLNELADDAESEANIDRRAIAYLRRIGERIPASPPTNLEMHSIAHNEAMLFGYASKVSEEWPDILAVRYHALTLQFDRTMRQFPDWR